MNLFFYLTILSGVIWTCICLNLFWQAFLVFILMGVIILIAVMVVEGKFDGFGRRDASFQE